MKTVKFLIFLLLFLPLSVNAQSGYKVRTVVIDPGHGGKDPGALGKNSYEKDITLAIAKYLGEYINKYCPDVTVVYTRKTDVFVPLDRRAAIANRANADLFISIHANWEKSHKVSGASTYVMGPHKTEDNLQVAIIENQAILHEKDYKKKYYFDVNAPEAYIVFSLYQNAYLDFSLDFATLVQEEFRTRAGRRDNGVRQAGFLVLWQTTMPSVLIETGYISNPEEEKFLTSKYGQEIIASAIFRACREFKKQFENEK